MHLVFTVKFARPGGVLFFSTEKKVICEKKWRVLKKMENEEGVRRVPLTILTGWLGSGKTTLMHHVLNTLGAAGLKVAWVQNTGPEPIIILVCIHLRTS